MKDSVRWWSSGMDGGCIACNAYERPPGVTEKWFVDIKLGRMWIRLCLPCLQQMQIAIAEEEIDT